MTTVSLIAAMSRERVIGHRGALPWRLPGELRRFKALTMGKPLVLGRRTFESIGRPLPGRRMVVLSRDPGFAPAGVEVFGGLDAALAALAGAGEVMIGGGAAVYAVALPRADRLLISVVYGDFAGDVRFPAFDAASWGVAEREDAPADAENPWAYTFFDLRRDPSLSPPPLPFPAGCAWSAPRGGA